MRNLRRLGDHFHHHYLDFHLDDRNPHGRMLISNHSLEFLSGGYHRCGNDWNRGASELDQCYKVYFPIAGAASLETTVGSFPLEAGQVHLISGFRLRAQSCPERMDVYWIHLLPESLYARFLLDLLPPVCSQPFEDCGWSSEDLARIVEIFHNPGNISNSPRSDVTLELNCRIHGLLWLLLSRFLAMVDRRAISEFQPEWSRLKSAIEFMQSEFLNNPQLSDIAAKVGMAPNHFHRRFSALFGLSPFAYMLNMRMNRARSLLTGAGLGIKEIGAIAGYNDPAYFSRVFSSHFGISPSEYRLSKPSG